MRILFDSKKAEFKAPFGCVAPGQTVTLHLHIPTAVSAWKVEIVLCYEDGSPARYHEMYRIEQRGAYDIYEGDFSLFAPGLHFYYFQIHAPHGMFRLFKQGDDTNMEEGDLWQISCISPDFTTPDWAKGAIIYQIFPDRFHRSGKCNLTGKLRPYTVHRHWDEDVDWAPDENGIVHNNDFFGGNFRGITEKMDTARGLDLSICPVPSAAQTVWKNKSGVVGVWKITCDSVSGGLTLTFDCAGQTGKLALAKYNEAKKCFEQVSEKKWSVSGSILTASNMSAGIYGVIKIG